MLNTFWLRMTPAIAATILVTLTADALLLSLTVDASATSDFERVWRDAPRVWRDLSTVVFPRPPMPYESFPFWKPASLTAEMTKAEMDAMGIRAEDDGDAMALFDRRFPEDFAEKKKVKGDAIVFPKEEASLSSTTPEYDPENVTVSSIVSVPDRVAKCPPGQRFVYGRCR